MAATIPTVQPSQMNTPSFIMHATSERLMQMPQISWAMFPRSNIGPLNLVLSTCMPTRCRCKLIFKFRRYSVSDDLATWLIEAAEAWRCERHCSIVRIGLRPPWPAASTGRFCRSRPRATGSTTTARAATGRPRKRMPRARCAPLRAQLSSHKGSKSRWRKQSTQFLKIPQPSSSRN